MLIQRSGLLQGKLVYMLVIGFLALAAPGPLAADVVPCFNEDSCGECWAIGCVIGEDQCSGYDSCREFCSSFCDPEAAIYFCDPDPNEGGNCPDTLPNWHYETCYCQSI